MWFVGIRRNSRVRKPAGLAVALLAHLMVAEDARARFVGYV